MKHLLYSPAQFAAYNGRYVVVVDGFVAVLAVDRVFALFPVVMNEHARLVDKRLFEQVHAQLAVRRATQVVTHGHHAASVVK